MGSSQINCPNCETRLYTPYLMSLTRKSNGKWGSDLKALKEYRICPECEIFYKLTLSKIEFVQLKEK